MQHNKSSLSEMREENLLKRAAKDPLIRFVLLMNEYHAQEHAYFPTTQARDTYKDALRHEIFKTSKLIPKGYGKKVRIWLGSSEQWKNDIDSIHVKM